MLLNREKYARELEVNDNLDTFGEKFGIRFDNFKEFLEWLDSPADLTDKEKCFLMGLSDKVKYVAMYNNELKLYDENYVFMGEVPMAFGYFSCWDNDYEKRKVDALIH